MGYPHYDLVQRSYAELIQEGKIKKRTDQEAVENDKGLMTRRAAYYANAERDRNHGILEKTGGNQSEGYSVDIIIHKDGTFWDVATDDGSMCKPVNGSERHDDALAPRWRQPTKELAQIEDGGVVEPPPGPGPGQPSGNEEVMAKLNEVLAQIEELHKRQGADTALIMERDDFNTQRVLDRLTQIVTDFEASAKKALALYLAMNRPGQPPTGEVPPGGETPPNDMLAMILKLLALLQGGNLPQLPETGADTRGKKK